MPIPVKIGARRFSSQSQALAEARRVRDQYADGEHVASKDEEFLTDLLYLHSEAPYKIGAGIARFSVNLDQEYRRTRCFYVHRTDGSSTDFSFKNCIEGAKPRQDRYNALRETISSQTVAHKERAFAGVNYVSCSIRGTPTKFADAHVDHVPPQTLRRLITDWLALENLHIDDIEITPQADNQFVAQMTDPSQRDRWIAYHAQGAVLRVVCSAANLSDVPRSARGGK